MKTKLFFIFLVLLITSISDAQEITVIDVKRNITLSDEDAVYKDFYVNAGEGSALRKNMVVNVKRKINVKDSASKSVGDFETVVGQLKIIQVGNKVSVAREYKLIPRDSEAMLEQIGIMSGDRVDLTDSYIDNTKPVKKTKTTETEAAKTEETKTADAGDAVIEVNIPAQEPARTASPDRDPANQSNLH